MATAANSALRGAAHRTDESATDTGASAVHCCELELKRAHCTCGSARA
jgi:hypothetical protein